MIVITDLILVFLLVTSLYANHGFFTESYTPLSAPEFNLANNVTEPAGNPDVLFTGNYSDTITAVLRSLYGNNTNAWIKKQVHDVPLIINNLKNANIYSLRLPGGSWSDKYFWAGTIPSDINAHIKNYNANGKNAILHAWNETSKWIANPDEMLKLCSDIGAIPQVIVNFGYSQYSTSADPVAAAASYAAHWVRKLNDTLGLGVKYFEIGNECYGPWETGHIVGTDTLTGSKYGSSFRVFADSMKAVDPTIKVGAVLYPFDGEELGRNWWSKGVLEAVSNHADYLIIHEYFTYDNNLNNVTTEMVFDSLKRIADDYSRVQTMVETYTDKSKDHFPIVMTEYNMRAGVKDMRHISSLFITMAIGELIRSGYSLANLWDIANGYSNAAAGDHGMLSRSENKSKGLPYDLADGTPHPSFYAYYYHTRFFGDQMIASTPYEDQDVRAYFSHYSTGEAGVIVVNKSAAAKIVQLNFNGLRVGNSYDWFTVSSDDLESGVVKINGIGGNPIYGPDNYASIKPKRSTFSGSPKFTAEAYSANFLLIKTDISPVKKTILSGSLKNSLKFTNNILCWRGKTDLVITIFDLQGRILLNGLIPSGGSLNLNEKFVNGCYLLKVNGQRLTFSIVQ